MSTGNRQGRGVRGSAAAAGSGAGGASGVGGAGGAGSGTDNGSKTGGGNSSSTVTPTPALSEVGPPPTVLGRIRALLPPPPPPERRVAEAAVPDPAGVAAKTISELAADCDTSETTVIRFCRAVGLKGYPELRIGLAAAAGIEDAASSTLTVGGDIGPHDSLAD